MNRIKAKTSFIMIQIDESANEKIQIFASMYVYVNIQYSIDIKNIRNQTFLFGGLCHVYYLKKFFFKCLNLKVIANYMYLPTYHGFKNCNESN